MVLTHQRIVDRIAGVLVVPCTTNVRGVASEAVLTVEDGMQERCVANAASVAVVYRRQIKGLICELPPERVNAVCGALQWFSGCGG